MPEVSAPASSANLGPGFDTLALALGLRCSVKAEPSETWVIEQTGPEASQSTDAVLEAATTVTHQPLSLTIINEIPIGRGLGSSAAARAAVVGVATLAVGGEISRDDVFSTVAALEGHPDNAAAAVFGGLVSVTPNEGVIPLDLAPRLELVIAVPNEALPTTKARSVLSGSIDRSAAVRSLQRLSALLQGLRTGDAGALASAGGDELHEAQRARLNPVAASLMAAARDAGALHVCWSGAGPSILAFVGPSVGDSVAEAVQAVLGDGGVAIRPEVDLDGLRY